MKTDKAKKEKPTESYSLKYRQPFSIPQAFLVSLLLQFVISPVIFAETGKFTLFTASISYGFSPERGTDQFKVAVSPPLTNCKTKQNQPYLVIFLGGAGNFIGYDNSTQTNYYTGAAQKIADMLATYCIHTLIVETTSAYLEYDGNPAATFNGPIHLGAAYLYDILITLQTHPFLKDASKWYLMGGSAGSLMSVKLLDDKFTAPNRSFLLDPPDVVILESLPSSGSVLTDCQHTNAPSHYESTQESMFGGGSCSNIKANPHLFNTSKYEFLNGSGINNYMDLGYKIAVLQGDNDPLFKDSLAVTEPPATSYLSSEYGWTMGGLINNFITVTGLTPTCQKANDGKQSTNDDLNISNQQKTWSCYSNKLYARTYENSGHNPIHNNNQAINDLRWFVTQ